MSQSAFAIPEPIPGDPDDVVTALETAAIFGAKGDTDEALRWVRHAATSAGETGRDARALDLARAASELGSPSSEHRQRTLPTPPPRPVSLRPPPPSESGREHAFALRPSQPPPSKPASVASRPANAAPKPASAATSRPPSVTSRPSNVTSRPPSVAPSKPVGLAPFRSENVVSSAPVRAPRNAARVSVSAGSEPGVFELRVLADGDAPTARSIEAFIVLVDPDADLHALERHK